MTDYEYAIRIQRGIPLPPRKRIGRFGAKPNKYPWDKMKIGDSFLFPKSSGRSGYASALFATQTRPGKRFEVRKLDDGSFRCWRVE